MMRAKLSGYMEPPSVVFNRYVASDTSLPARYARATARFRMGGQDAVQQAIAEAEGLIRTEPGNAYFWELKGDFLQKAGRPREAIPALRKALQLKNNEAPLISVQLAQAMLQAKDPA